MAFPCPGSTKSGTRAKKKKRDEKEQTGGSRQEWERPESVAVVFSVNVRDRKTPPANLTD